jgi:hypothetical protein
LASTDTIALSQHPFVTGQRVTYSSGGGSPIGGLISGTAYYITKTDQNSFKLASSYVNAITNITIDLVGTGTGVTHSFNVAFDGVNTKFKATYSNGTKCTISRAAQLDIAINGVVQQPYDSNPPPNGFTIEADATIVFSTAPLAGYTFWGKALSGSTASVEISDNSIDNFTGNGSTTNFTLSKTPANSQNVLVTINGVTQYPSDATGTRSYSTNANVLVFTAPPANGSLIQVRYIGFAGPTSSNVTGFYGRTGNVVLNSSDGIGVGTAKIGTGIVGLATALLVEGNVRITGILTIGTSSITLNGSTGSTDSIVVGSSFIRNNSIGLGQTTTTGRNAGINTAEGTIIYNSSLKEVQVYKGSIGWTNIGDGFINATGGTISDYNENNTIYRAHIFTSSGTFSVTSAPSASTVEYLVVAGGGGGGFNAGAGGGAGGFRTGTGIPVSASPGSYSVTVGGGGNGSANDAPQTATNGSSSIFSTITSAGGGYGCSSNASGNPGGSGGGSSANNPIGAGNTPPTSPPQGNPGGLGNSGDGSSRAGGGGGGAGSAGNGTTNANLAGSGGNGLASAISGTSVTYAGGGGGSSHTGGPTAIAPGGTGGGGAGGAGTWPIASPGTAGTYATGGGGGAGSGGSGLGGLGGSGIVVIRYQIGGLTATAKATGGAISYAGGKTIHTFLSSGTFTITNPSLTSVDYLVVAGGAGGGGGWYGGGGGAGGFRTGTGLPVTASPGIYPVAVGAGGNGSITVATQGGNGTSSIFSTITSTGGGGGGSRVGPGGGANTAGLSGGSGGGGAFGSSAGGAGNTPPTSPPQGNPGGSNTAPQYGAGGGGASQAGPAGQSGPLYGAPGGNGSASSISGTSVTYAGGGAGGTSNPNGYPGGTGGGGTSAGSSPAVDGTQSTGGGGGGGTGTETGTSLTGVNKGSNGGSGIVIISYPS